MAEKDLYTKMLEVPGTLSEEIERFDEICERVQADFENEKSGIAEDFDAEESASVGFRDKQKGEAEARFNTWSNKLNEYLAAASGAMNRTKAIFAKAYPGMGSEASAEKAIEFMETETQERSKRRRAEDNSDLIQLCNEEISLNQKVQTLQREIRQEVEEQKTQEFDAADRLYASEHGTHEKRKRYRLKLSERAHTLRKEYENDAFAERVERILAPDAIASAYQKMQQQQPNYELYEPAAEFPEGIQFGYAGYDVTEHLEDPLKAAVLKKRFQYTLREANGRTYMTVPYGYAFADDRFSTLFEFESDKRKEAGNQIRDLALNLYMSIPANKCWCTFIDPVSLGDTFALFAPMGEKDENNNGDERAIDTRVWCTEKEIEERLQLVIAHTTDVIRRCLQGRYTNILEYNKDAGINAEPLRFIVVMDFPKHFSDKSLDYLESILDNGPKTGVYTLIAGDAEEIDSYPEGSAVWRIRDRFKNIVTSEDGCLYVQEETVDGCMRYFPFKSPEVDQYFSLVEGIRSHLGETIEVTYPMVSENLPDKKNYWFNKSALNGISVPIGMEGAKKIINLEFGNPYHSFAAMISGTVGSGKSTLMHTIIQSVLFNYGPEDVQIYLLDFKQGVEFKCYADFKLPNFRVISVETEPEFGLAVLNELHDEMARRSAKFKSAGVVNIESYWQYKGQRGESHADMPRILIIFDEVQALLNDEESEIVKTCCSRIKELVTMAAHAFGMHLVLSTQTFENVKGLDSGVYSNIHTRLVLKSTKESVNLLLDNDNDIAGRLVSVDPGQGVFNSNAGDKDANRMFRVAIISPEERNKWMQEVRELEMEVMAEQPQKPRILLSGPEDDSENALTVFAEQGERPLNLGDPSCHLYIGESLTIENNFKPALWSGNGQNLLLAGRDSGEASLPRMVVGYSVLSILYEAIRLQGSITEPIFTVFDLGGRSHGASEMDMLLRAEEIVPEAFRIIQPNQILNGIQTLYQELHSGRRQFVIFYGLNRAKQLTTGTYERSPKDVLMKLFAEGPENGMNFIVWANDPGLFLEQYGMALSSFDNRLAFGMDDSEFKQITGESGPKNCSPMNAISYNAFGDNQKIRLYGQPTGQWLDQFLMNVRKYVD